ncbi:MAG: NAD(P)-dependent oxidoreductase, partial [Bacteroidia bacterium]|nr:NAD(P)-dependent oxidoreductase [Bacteroidia bacterium]
DVGAAQPLMDVMGKKTLHLGGHGKGSSMKMIVNMMLAQTMLAFSEGLSLGQALGIEQKTLLDVLLSTPIVPPYLNAIRGKIESDHFEANFPLRWMRKDLHLAALSAYEYEVPMPSLHIAQEMFTLALREGLGDEDFSAIYRFVKGRR